MLNYNLKIMLTRLKGAKVMEVEGKHSKRLCVVIPIDNDEGTVVDSYESKIDGLPTTKPLNDVQLHLSAFEFKEKRYGQSHGLKACFSRKRLERMTEDEVRSMPFVGHMKPWAQPKSEDEDLPAGNENEEDW